jgi:exopolysaccharide biosynthesis protein
MRRFGLIVVLTVLVVAVIKAGLCLPYWNVHVVKVKLGPDVEIRPAVASGVCESFKDMMGRLKPYAAINGTFYDTDYRPMGDVLIGGKLVKRGRYRNAVAYKSTGEVHFLRVSKGRIPWTGYRAGLAAGPRLAHNGKIALDPVADGFTKRSLTISAYRSGVGRTKDGYLLLVTTKQPMTLSEFAKQMLDLGSVEAMNLDGGGACGLYHNGKVIVQPYLQMTTVLAVYKK